MKLQLNGKKVTIYPILLKKLGKGTQGKVYQYHNKALKIIRSDSKDLTLEDYHHLKNIKTKRILLPEDSFTDFDGNLRCYTTELIKNKNKLYKMMMTEFLEEVYQTEEELDLLSENYVTVHDWLRKNFMFDGMFRFVDAGKYKINPSQDRLEIRKHNQNVFNYFILGEMITSYFYPDYDLGMAKYPMLKQLEMEYRKSHCTTIGEYIESTINRKENFLQYIIKVKRKM